MVIQCQAVIKKWDRKQLLQSLQSVTEVYYKVRQVLQGVTDCYYKVRKVLQNATVIKKWDVTMLGWMFLNKVTLLDFFSFEFCRVLYLSSVYSFNSQLFCFSDLKKWYRYR